MNTFYGALPRSYMCQCSLHAVLWSHRGTLLRFISAGPTSQYRMTFIPLSVSLLNDFADPIFDGVGPAAYN